MKVYASKDWINDSVIFQNCLTLANKIVLPEIEGLYFSPDHMAYGDGKIVAVAYNSTTIFCSNDNGASWTPVTLSDKYFNYKQSRGIAYGGGKFVVLLSDHIGYSYDGINWNLVSYPTTQYRADWTGIAYGNGKFVAVDWVSGYTMWSEDGIDWSIDRRIREGFTDVAWVNNRFIAFGANGYSKMADDGTWHTVLLSGGPSYQIVFVNNKYIGIGSDKLYVSTSLEQDGSPKGWAEYPLPDNSWNRWSSITYGNGCFVAVAKGTDCGGGVYSNNGTDWSVSSMSTTEAWTSVCFADNKFIAISESGAMVVSCDGVNWSNYVHSKNGNILVQNNDNVTDTLRGSLNILTKDELAQKSQVQIVIWEADD